MATTEVVKKTISPQEVLERTYDELIGNESDGLSRRGTLVKNLDGWKFPDDDGKPYFQAERGGIFDFKEGRGILVTLSKPDSFSTYLTAVLIRANEVQLAPEEQATFWEGPVRQSWDKVLENEAGISHLLRNDHLGSEKRPYKVVVALGKEGSLVTPAEGIQTTLSHLQVEEPTFCDDMYESGFMPGLMIVCKPGESNPGPWDRKVVNKPAGYREDTSAILAMSITNFFHPENIGKYLVAEKLVARINERRKQFEGSVKAWSALTHCSEYSVRGSFVVDCFERYKEENGFDSKDAIPCLVDHYPGIRTIDTMEEVPGRDGRWHTISNFPGFDQPLYYRAANIGYELLVPYPR